MIHKYYPAIWTWLCLLGLLSSVASCDFSSPFFPCQSSVPQSHKFGQAKINISTHRPTFRLGDTLFVNFRLSQHLYDSLTQQAVTIKEGIDLWVRLTSSTVPITTGSTFAIDTTIFNVFDQYFTTRMLRGTKRTAYNYSCQLINGYWELAIQYIALKKGNYILNSRFEKISPGDSALPKGVCMLGDDQTFNASIKLGTINNQLKRVYANPSASEDEYFGLVVE